MKLNVRGEVMEIGEAKKFFHCRANSTDFAMIWLPEVLTKNLDTGELWVRLQPGNEEGTVKGLIYKKGEWNE